MSDILFFLHVDHIVKIMSVYVYKSLPSTHCRLEVAYRRKVDLIANHTSALFRLLNKLAVRGRTYFGGPRHLTHEMNDPLVTWLQSSRARVFDERVVEDLANGQRCSFFHKFLSEWMKPFSLFRLPIVLLATSQP